MHWSPQQELAIQEVSRWYKAGADPVFYLAGYAGTGKTTIARHLVSETGAKACYGAFTGKAASVMRSSGCEDAATLHSLIYKFKQGTNGKFIKKVNKGQSSRIVQSDIIVVDECSMVDGELGRDLEGFGKPILVLGDPAQLPPVKGGGHFTAREPDQMLTEIHRQAEGNPIIRMATDVRQGKGIDFCRLGESAVVSKADFKAGYDVTSFDQLLCGLNKSRMDFNIRLRQIKGITSELPMEGDRLVCLKNDRDLQIFNGGMFTALSVWPDDGGNTIQMTVRADDDDKIVSVEVRKEIMLGTHKPHWAELKETQEFTYGYALTVHKAQGSQWNDVVLFDEAFGSAEDRQRWLYTGITRAANRIVIVR